MPSVQVTAAVQVCCMHHREKRQIVELEFDPAAWKVHLCPCCENLFLRVTDEPGLCVQCGGKP